MASQRKLIIIGETRFSAGIFLSERIARSKMYGNNLKMEKFGDFYEAEAEFFHRYPSLKENPDFRLNKLFKVRENPGFDVYWSRSRILIAQGFSYQDVWHLDFEEAGEGMCCRNFEDYEDAQCFAGTCFARAWHDSRYLIRRRLKLGVIYHLEDFF